MTPENWPEPIGRVEELHSLEAVDIHVKEMPDVGEAIYTATQVREIVRMEVEAIADLIAKTAATHHTTPWGDGYNQAALDIESGIRARLMENRDDSK